MMKSLKIRPTRQSRSFSWVGLSAALVLSVALVVLGVAQEASANAADDPEMNASDFTNVDRYIKKEMEATRLPGLALGIVKGDRIAHLKGFGKADDSGRNVTPETPFLLGSSTKSITALATMQLVEAGKVDLDAPVQRYVPWFRVADREASSRITVRDLLNQTSGLPTREAGNRLQADDSDDALERYVRDLRTVELTAQVGKKFQYSNYNYNVLGLIVQTVSGQSYEDYVHQHIFAQLEMRHSYTTPEQAREHGRAMGHRYWFGRPFEYEMPYNRAQLPSGFVNASAQDMTHYLIAQLDGGNYEDARVLSPQGIAQMHHGAIPTGQTVMPGQKEASYAMGWFVGETNRVRTVSHSGNTAGFHSEMVLAPEEEWGVVLLMNGNNGLSSARIDGIAPGVMSLLVGKQPPPVPASDSRQTLFTGILIVVAIQLLGIGRSVVLLRRWHREPARRPHGWHRVTLRIVPFLVTNLLWALLALTGLKLLSGGSLLDFPVFTPDLGYSALLSAAIGIVWGLLRPVLVLRALHDRRTPIGTGAAKEQGVEVKA